MRRKRIWLSVLLAGLLASGCSVPPSVEQPSAKTRSTQPGTSGSPAVVELTSQARRALDSRQFDEAVQLLERAINIEPRNGSLWHELARARYAQGNYEQAIQLAKRSNALPNVEPSLKSKNDELIQASRHALGN